MQATGRDAAATCSARKLGTKTSGAESFFSWGIKHGWMRTSCAICWTETVGQFPQQMLIFLYLVLYVFYFVMRLYLNHELAVLPYILHVFVNHLSLCASGMQN